MTTVIRKIDSIAELITRQVLIVCVLSMLFLSVLNIFLRWFNMTLFWVEPLVRHLVFLSAFLGGALATGKRSHIGIDVLHRWLENKKDSGLAKLILISTTSVSIGTLIWLVYAGIEFMKVELQYGRDVFWGVHSGFLVGIIPFGFGLICLRFIVILICSLSRKQPN